MALPLASLALSLTTKTRGFVAGMGKAGGALGKFKGTVANVLGPLGPLFLKATVAVGAFAAALVAGLRKAAMFQKQMAEVNTMMFGQEAVLPKLADGVRRLSREMGEGTATLTKGLYDILSAQIPVADAMEVLEVATKAAKAGMTDTGTTADAITSILNAYGLEASNAAAVSETLARTVFKGKTRWAELSQSIGNVVSQAAIAGVSFEEVSAALATLTRSGIKTPEAITALNRALRTIAAPSEKQIELLAEMGIKSDEFGAKVTDLGQLFKMISESATVTNSKLAKAFGIRGFKAVAALSNATEAFSEDLAFMNNQVNDSTKNVSLLDDQYNKATKTLSHVYDQMKATFGDLFVEVFTPMIPAFERLLGFMKDLFNTVRENTPDLGNMGETLVNGIIKGIQIVLKFGSTFISVIVHIVSYIVEWTQKIVTLFRAVPFAEAMVYLMKKYAELLFNFWKATAIFLANFATNALIWLGNLLKKAANKITLGFYRPLMTRFVSMTRGISYTKLVDPPKEVKKAWDEIEKSQGNVREGIGKFRKKMHDMADSVGARWEKGQKKEVEDTKKATFEKIKYPEKFSEMRKRVQQKDVERNWEYELQMIDQAKVSEQEKLQLRVDALRTWRDSFEEASDDWLKINKKLMSAEKKLFRARERDAKKAAADAKKAAKERERLAKEAYRKYVERVNERRENEIEELDFTEGTETEKLKARVQIQKKWLKAFRRGTKEWKEQYKKLRKDLHELDKKIAEDRQKLRDEEQTDKAKKLREDIATAEERLRMWQHGAKGRIKLEKMVAKGKQQLFVEEMRRAAQLARGGTSGDPFENAQRAKVLLEEMAADETLTAKQRAQAAKALEKVQAKTLKAAKKKWGDEAEAELKKREAVVEREDMEQSATDQAISDQDLIASAGEEAMGRVGDAGAHAAMQTSDSFMDALARIEAKLDQILAKLTQAVDALIGKLGTALSKASSVSAKVAQAGENMRRPGLKEGVFRTVPKDMENDPRFFGEEIGKGIKDGITTGQSAIARVVQQAGRSGLARGVQRALGDAPPPPNVTVGPIQIGRLDDDIDVMNAGEEISETIMDDIYGEQSL